MKKPETIIIILIVVTCIVLACLVGVAIIITRSERTAESPESIKTEAAQTIQAQLTLDALLTLVPPATLFSPARVSDRTDGKIAHLDGLNFSRAKHGRTVRKTVDCIISAIAQENGFTLFHNDNDFAIIEKCTGLKTLKI